MSGAETTNNAAVTGNDPDAIKRKERSERILVSEGVPINSELPLFKLSCDTEPRSKRDVALRALCVLMTAMKAQGMDQTMVLRVVRQYGLATHFSPIEKEFIRDAAPTANKKNAFSWRYEAAWVLLWALGYIEGLSIPNRTCDLDRAVACMRERNTKSFVNDAELRPLSQLLDQSDLIYRYQASMTDAEQNQRAIPADLKANVVFERLFSLNWLIRDPDREWDAINVYS